MRAMVLEAARTPLRETELPDPQPGAGQVLVGVHACAVCRTDLHVVDGELPRPKLPLVPGHQIVGRVLYGGERFAGGERGGGAGAGGALGRAGAWASLGWAAPPPPAATARADARTSATTRASPATTST